MENIHTCPFKFVSFGTVLAKSIFFVLLNQALVFLTFFIIIDSNKKNITCVIQD